MPVMRRSRALSARPPARWSWFRTLLTSRPCGRLIPARSGELVDVPARVAKIISGRAAAGDRQDRFRVVVRDGLPETWLDVDKVDQILGNLIENAVRHGAGTVSTVVEPAAVADAPGVAVSVRDQGQGIAPDLASRVFRQFWRAKRRGGAGLGLFIVKGLVEAHGGTITVATAPGGGAEFRFIMPAGTPDFG